MTLELMWWQSANKYGTLQQSGRAGYDRALAAAAAVFVTYRSNDGAIAGRALRDD